jgi:hypothetical protein
MDPFGTFGAAEPVEVEVLTDAYRISGTIQTRFGRLTDILNQQAAPYVTIGQATISEHADPTGVMAASSVLVAVSAILIMSAPNLTGESNSEMRIEKRPVRAELAMPPIRVTGTIHVPQGSRPIDGLLNVSDRFLAMTDVTISCGAFPDLAGTATAVAVCRDRAQLLLVADDEESEQLLADVIDENTAEAWLRPDERSE